MRVLIVGGGIAGLAAARKLALEARARGVALTCELVEASTRLGGKIKTEREDGFIVEAGPDAFISIKPAAMRLCRELGIDADVVGTDPRFQKTFIVKRGQLLEIPGGMSTFVPTEIKPFIRTPLLSWLAKARMGLEPFIPRRRGDGDVSMADFFTRRIGRAGFEWLVEPLLAGIYAGDGQRLGLQGTFPRYLEMEREHGSLLRAAFAAKTAQAKAPPPSGKGPSGLFLSLRAGLIDLVEATAQAARELGVTITTDAPVQSLDFTEKVKARFAQRTWEGDAVIVCAPAFTAADLIADQAPSVAGMLRQIEYVSTATITMAFDASRIRATDAVTRALAAYGFVVPRPEKRDLLACTYTSSKWPGRAPDDQVLLRCYVGGDGRESILDLDDDALVDRALDEMRAIIGFSAPPWRTWVHRWPRAMPQYRVGHPARMRRIEERVSALPGLFLAGAAYRGIGIPDCIQDGETAALRVLDNASAAMRTP